MLRDSLVKIRALIGFSLLVVIYPTILLCAVFAKIFDFLNCFRVEKNIKGEVAVVTGAAQGLGKAIAIELAKKGCHVAVTDINMEGAERTAKYISHTYQVKAKAYKVNVVNYAEIVKLNEDVTRDLGEVTVLINNAGMLMLPNFINPDWEDVQRMINVNMTSHFWTKSVFLPKMKQLRKGYILTVSSVAGLFSLPYNSVYTATKFGTAGHMRALRQEMVLEGHSGIHVTTLMPPFMNTNENVLNILGKSGFDSIYPVVSGAEVAQRAVLGMLRNEEEIVIPGFVALLYRMLTMLPMSWQTLAVILGKTQMSKMTKTMNEKIRTSNSTSIAKS